MECYQQSCQWEGVAVVLLPDRVPQGPGGGLSNGGSVSLEYPGEAGEGIDERAEPWPTGIATKAQPHVLVRLEVSCTAGGLTGVHCQGADTTGPVHRPATPGDVRKEDPSIAAGQYDLIGSIVQTTLAIHDIGLLGVGLFGRGCRICNGDSAHGSDGYNGQRNE